MKKKKPDAKLNTENDLHFVLDDVTHRDTTFIRAVKRLWAPSPGKTL